MLIADKLADATVEKLKGTVFENIPLIGTMSQFGGLPNDSADLVCWKYIYFACKIIGSLWIEINSESKAFLGIFIADKQYRGKGIGTKAIKLAIENKNVDELYLNVRMNNQKAINCYHKIGFKDVRQYVKDNSVEVIEMKYEKE